MNAGGGRTSPMIVRQSTMTRKAGGTEVSGGSQKEKGSEKGPKGERKKTKATRVTAPANAATASPPSVSPPAAGGAATAAARKKSRRRTRNSVRGEGGRADSNVVSALVQQGQEAEARVGALRQEAKGAEERASKDAADARERATELVQARTIFSRVSPADAARLLRVLMPERTEKHGR